MWENYFVLFCFLRDVYPRTLALWSGSSFEMPCLLGTLLHRGVISYCINVHSRSTAVFTLCSGWELFQPPPPTSHTFQAAQCISRERKVVAKNNDVEVIYGLARIDPAAAITQWGTKKPLSGGAQPVIQPTSYQGATLAFQSILRNVRPGHPT